MMTEHMLIGVFTKAYPSFSQLFRYFSIIVRFPLVLLLIVGIILLLLCGLRESLDTFFVRFLANALVAFLVILVPAPVRKKT